MNTRLITPAVCILACALLMGAGLSQRELTRLRAQNKQVVSELESAQQHAIAEASQPLPEPLADDSAKIELLRLRNEVSQLMERKKGLASIRAENQKLQSQVAAKSTNTANNLSPGYLLKREAKWVGMNTPEDTLQSFLWAIQNRDPSAMLRLLAPTPATLHISNQLQRNAEEFFNSAAIIPGMLPKQKQTLADGSLSLKVEFLAGDESQEIRFYNINGEWKMDMP